MRLNASFKNINDTIRDAAQSLTKDFVSGLVSGKSVMDSLGAAATNLSAKLTDKAIESLFSGDLLSAGIQGIGALVTGLFGASSKKREKEEKEAKAAIDRMEAYGVRAQIAALDTTTREGALAQFDIQAQSQRSAEARDGNRAIAQLELALAAERLAIVDKFDKAALDAAKEAADAKAKAEQDALNASLKRMQDYRDRLEATTVDTSTLGGALAAFDYKATRERADEIAAGGEAINDLVAAQEAERFQIYKKFNDAALDAAKKTAEELQSFVEGVAKNITAYLQGLKTGPSSILSPQEQLAAAKANFDKQLALANSGDRDALSGITQVAQTLLDQARGFYASSAGYTDIYKQVTDALAGTAAINPGTVADSDSKLLAAIAGTTAAVTTTGASNDALSAAQNAMIAAQNALAAQQTVYLQTQVSLLGAINTLADRFVNAINGLGQIEAGIGNTHTGQNQQMIAWLISISRSSGQSSGGTIWSWLGFQNGGQIPGYANGGVVGNGSFGVDSVLARYAGGGSIGLAGGEYVMPADTTRLWKPQLDAMRAGAMPRNDNRRSSSNDNGQDLRELGRLIATGNAAIVNRLERVEAAFGTGTAAIATGARRVAEKKKMPGS